jgi:hypothetical protein
MGGPNDGESEVDIKIIAPSKAKKRQAVGVGAKGDEGQLERGDEPSGEGSFPDDPDVLPDVPDAPPAPEDSKE